MKNIPYDFIQKGKKVTKKIFLSTKKLTNIQKFMYTLFVQFALSLSCLNYESLNLEKRFESSIILPRSAVTLPEHIVMIYISASLLYSDIDQTSTYTYDNLHKFNGLVPNPVHSWLHEVKAGCEFYLRTCSNIP